MKTISSALSSAADDAASLWAARLDGGVLTADQRQELDCWLAEHPDHRALLTSYCQLSADLEQQLPALAERLEERPVVGSPPARRGFTKLAWASASLAAAAAVAFTLVQLNRPVTSPLASVATAMGQRQDHVLADGSRVELNAQTNLTIQLTDTARQVRLGAGQAFFSVADDRARPFLVETPAGSVRVTGTEFDVRAEDGALEVVVLEGSVQVRPADTAAARPISLQAGDQFRSDREPAVVQLSPAALDAALAWREGHIVFHDATLAEALARFSQYHGRRLVALGDAATLSIGGRYSLDDLDGFLAALEIILPVQVSSDLSGTTTVTLRQSS